MKTVHVETGRHVYGGAQQVLYIARGLAERGIDSTLVCVPGSDVAAAARDLDLELVELPCLGDLDLRFIWRLRQALERISPDIVHCHSRRGADFLGGQAAAMLGLPAVVSRRVDNPDTRVMAALRYRTFKRVVAISDAIAAELRNAGVPPDKIRVIRSAVDVTRFDGPFERARLEEEFNIRPEELAVACAAQLIARKGQHTLLDAVAELEPRHRNLRVVLFGQGADEAALKAKCAALGLETRVQFAGFRHDLDDYLGAFDVLVHPALAEGLGVITLKAQAAGVPVVASAVGGLPEAVGDNESGRLVPPGDVAALVTALDGVLGDSALRRRYAVAAKQRMRASFSIDTMLDAHIDLYNTVLNGVG